MSEKTYTLDNGHEIEADLYVDSLRKAWAVYGALVADGSLPAYNFDGSEKVQLAKWTLVSGMVGTIANALANFNCEMIGSNFAVWEDENRPKLWTSPRVGGRAVEDEDFPDPAPTGDGEIVAWIRAALKSNKLPYKLVHIDNETQSLVDALNALAREADSTPADEPTKPTKKKGGKKSKKTE